MAAEPHVPPSPMTILSENCKKENPKSVKELLRLKEKGFLQGVCYFINSIPIFV
jgi:hypothetical protein